MDAVFRAFNAHIQLLRFFLTHRQAIVANIEILLNAQRKPVRHLQDGSHLSHQLEDCFFTNPALTASQSLLKGQLEQAHRTSEFRPRQVHHVFNDLIHPAELMIRGLHCWRQTQWPSRGGRLHYAHTLFHLYLLRQLQFLSLRLWDEHTNTTDDRLPGDRLAEIQGVLDDLWQSSPPYQPIIVRDARWLIPLAQSLITDELAPYFEIARQVAHTLPEADALEIQKAHVRMLGGHLTSQIRHYSTKDSLSINDPGLVARNRSSNALDLALLVQGLVPLLKAYERSLPTGDECTRLTLAGAIYQGISSDPELFLSRPDLLSAYSMIEHVFITADRSAAAGNHIAYSPLGERHVQLLKEYSAVMDRLIQPLRDDLPRFRPVDSGYSPYGILFGLPSNLIEHMALKAVQRDAETRFSLEDVFRDAVLDDAGTSAAKLAWINGWRKLPHIDREIQRRYEYPQQFAHDIYNRISDELSRRASQTAASDDAGTGRLHLISDHDVCGDGSATLSIPELPAHYFVSSDQQLVAAHKAEPYDQTHLLRDRQEGHFLVSYDTPGGWIALKKNALAEVLGAGRDATIAGLPLEAANVLRLMCTGLVAPATAPRHVASCRTPGIKG